MKRLYPILFLLWSLLVFQCQIGDQTENNSSSEWRKIEAPDFTTISPVMFNDSELDIPFFLAHFHRIANAVVEEGDNKGFIDISVWRNPKDNKPYNARIMESILTLAYFYATDRPWNVYYGSEQVRFRLEAAMQFWCKIQAEDGRFSEYGKEKWNLAATAFATKFMGETLQLLSKGPGIDQEILKRTVEADRKAIMAVLTLPDLWEFGKGYSNQYSNVWSGALAYLDLYHDEEMEQLFLQKFEKSIEAFQSPAGYFYERNGPDFAYNLGTHENNLMMAYHYTKGTKIGDIIIDKSRRFTDWLVLNIVPESDDMYFLNRSIETRRNMAVVELNGPFITQGLALAKEVPLMRPFLRSSEVGSEIIQQKRDSLKMLWPETKKLDTGNFFAYTPYDFLHRRVSKWFPTQKERQEAIEQIPCLTDKYFIKTLNDTRKNVSFTYINMPGYYAVFNHGEIISKQQRYGLTLLWSKETGVIWQSQTRNDAACWGSRIDDSTIMEAMDIKASIFVDGQMFKAGKQVLTENSVIEIKYKAQGISKEVLFRSNEIEVNASAGGNLKETIPLVLDGESNILLDGSIVEMQKNSGSVVINANAATVEEQKQEFLVDDFELSAVTLSSMNELSYTVKLE